MRLTDLDARFVREVTPTGYRRGGDLDGAQGVLFECPKCGRHSVRILFANPINAAVAGPECDPDNADHPRWTASGSGLHDLTLTPSVNLDTEKNRQHPGNCLWHGWVANGDAQ